MIKITYYLDVISSWCHYVEPVWASIRETFGDDIKMNWEIAMIPSSGLPATAEEEDWYYRRSGLTTRKTEMLNSGWVEPGRTEYLEPNIVPVACRELGFVGDEVRVAITKAGIVEGQKVGDLHLCVDIAASVSGLSKMDIFNKVSEPETESILRRSTEKFFDYGVDQRPAFYLESEIGDRAIFSGLVHKEPLFATIQAMMDDVRAYRSWNAHMGSAYKEA